MYALNLASSYLIMLAVMTCNGGLFVTVIVGLSLGHFVWKSKHSHDSSETCHVQS